MLQIVLTQLLVICSQGDGGQCRGLAGFHMQDFKLAQALALHVVVILSFNHCFCQGLGSLLN